MAIRFEVSKAEQGGIGESCIKTVDFYCLLLNFFPQIGITDTKIGSLV